MKHGIRRATGLLVVAMTMAGSIAFGWGENLWSHDRIEIGVRLPQVTLLDDRQGQAYSNSFIGSITRLENESVFWPPRLFIQARANTWLAAGASVDRMRIGLWDHGGTDGAVDLDGWLIYLQGRYPGWTFGFPYLEAGWAHYRADFDADPAWSRDGTHDFLMDSAAGPYLGGGFALNLRGRWMLDLYARWMDIKSDGRYVNSADASWRPIPFTLTLEHLMAGLGVLYHF